MSLFGPRSNKKGNAIIEVTVIMVVLLVFGLLSIFSYMVFEQMNADIADNDDLSQEAKDVSGSLFSKFAKLMDNLFLLMYALFILFAIVSAWMIDSKPIMFAVSIILLIVVLIAAPIIANAYDDIASDPDVASYANDLGITSWVMRHLLELTVAVGFLILIVLYMKFR